MAIYPGSLRERITVQVATESRNGLGEVTQAWSTFTSRWASVTGLSSREVLLQGQAKADTTHRVRVRYIAGMTISMRILWRERVLEIDSLLEHANRSEHEILCTERIDQ